MLRLYILRHAKSSWAIPGQSDFDRSLNERGKSDLPKIRSHLRQHSIMPCMVYCSTAQRTRETFAGVEPGLSGNHETRFVDGLYSGTTETYLAHVQESMQNPCDKLIVGHNPSCEMLALNLSGDGVPEALSAVSTKYPTGSMVTIRFDVDDWSDVTPGTGYLESFIFPKALPSG